MVARQLEIIIAGAGHVVVGIAATMGKARKLAVSPAPDLTIVDLSLAFGMTVPAIGRFTKEECGVELVFATANARRLPDDVCGAIGIVEKPFTRGDLLSSMSYIASQVLDGQIPEKTPKGIRLPARPVAI